MQQHFYSDSCPPPPFSRLYSLGAEKEAAFPNQHPHKFTDLPAANGAPVSINKREGASGRLLVASGSGRKGRASAAAQEDERSILSKRRD